MLKPLAALLIAGAACLPAAAQAARPWEGPVYTDDNKHWLDYKTDISEAQRELRSDLRHAHDLAARERAWDEYHRELADARSDFRQAMAKRGVYVTPRLPHGERRGTVTMMD